MLTPAGANGTAAVTFCPITSGEQVIKSMALDDRTAMECEKQPRALALMQCASLACVPCFLATHGISRVFSGNLYLFGFFLFLRILGGLLFWRNGGIGK